MRNHDPHDKLMATKLLAKLDDFEDLAELSETDSEKGGNYERRYVEIVGVSPRFRTALRALLRLVFRNQLSFSQLVRAMRALSGPISGQGI